MNQSKVPFKSLKLLVASVITCPPVGRCIGALYGERIPFHGRRIDVRATGIPDANKASLFWGTYESAEYRFVTKYLSPDVSVIEVGSSIGAISCMIAGELSAGTRLVCVEANPRLLAALERNLAAHADHLSATVVHAAVGMERGVATFQISDNNLVSSVAGPGGHDGAAVACVTLADLTALAGSGPWQLVADIEGAEVSMLAAGPEAWAGCNAIIMELHDTHWNGQSVSRADLRTMICDLGFDVIDSYGAVVMCHRGQLAGK
jgi:FkbM family methyltransferase